MTQSDLATNLEQGADEAGGKASKTFPHLCLVQLVILIAFVLRLGASFFAPDDRTGETAPALGYLFPFFVAFFIWPVIYAVQGLFSIWQLFQRPGSAPDRRLEAIMGMAPGWTAMSLITVAWNWAPNLWLAGLGLTAVVPCLYSAWLKVVDEKDNWQDYILLNACITLHLGWGTAAALLTWNNVFAELTSSPAANLAFLFFELALAAGLSSFLALRHKSPLLVCTVAWAVFWIGMGMIFPMGRAKEQYDVELGVWRYVLGACEIGLAAGLVAVGFKAKASTELDQEAK